MRISLASALVVLVGALVPFLLGKGVAYAACLWTHRDWTLAVLGLWFLMLKYLARRLMELSMRRPGSRLDAGQEPR